MHVTLIASLGFQVRELEMGVQQSTLNGTLNVNSWAYHAGGHPEIHDLFGGALISRICNAYFLPKVFWIPKIWIC